MSRSFLYFVLVINAAPWTAHGHLIERAGIEGSSALRSTQISQAGPLKDNLELPSANLTTNLTYTPTYPIDCFDSKQYKLEPAIPEDCEFVINEYILRLPNPMQEQTFGFNESADVDLSLSENREWHHGQCVISVGSTSRIEEDTFRPVDVAIVAQRVMQTCIVGTKEALGGSSGIGSIRKNFYVIIGGLRPPPWAPDHSLLSLPTLTASESPVSSFGPRPSGMEESANGLWNLSGSSSWVDTNVRTSCVKPGMPAAAGGALIVNNCIAAAKDMLSNPKILDLQLFTTESTGGIQVPFVEEANGCYFMVDTHARLSTSIPFTLLKVVYFASEVMRRCPLGGVARLSSPGNFFVSVTAIDPGTVGNGLSLLLNSTSPTSGPELWIS